MKHRIVSGLVLVPLTIVLSTTPAYGRGADRAFRRS